MKKAGNDPRTGQLLQSSIHRTIYLNNSSYVGSTSESTCTIPRRDAESYSHTLSSIATLEQWERCHPPARIRDSREWSCSEDCEKWPPNLGSQRTEKVGNGDLGVVNGRALEMPPGPGLSAH